MKTLKTIQIEKIVDEIVAREGYYWNASISTLETWVIKDPRTGDFSEISGAPLKQESYRRYDGNVITHYPANREKIIASLEKYEGDCEVAFIRDNDEPCFHDVIAHRKNGVWYEGEYPRYYIQGRLYYYGGEEFINDLTDRDIAVYFDPKDERKTLERVAKTLLRRGCRGRYSAYKMEIRGHKTQQVRTYGFGL